MLVYFFWFFLISAKAKYSFSQSIAPLGSFSSLNVCNINCTCSFSLGVNCCCQFGPNETELVLFTGEGDFLYEVYFPNLFANGGQTGFGISSISELSDSDLVNWGLGKVFSVFLKQHFQVEMLLLLF